MMDREELMAADLPRTRKSVYLHNGPFTVLYKKSCKVFFNAKTNELLCYTQLSQHSRIQPTHLKQAHLVDRFLTVKAEFLTPDRQIVFSAAALLIEISPELHYVFAAPRGDRVYGDNARVTGVSVTKDQGWPPGPHRERYLCASGNIAWTSEADTRKSYLSGVPSGTWSWRLESVLLLWCSY